MLNVTNRSTDECIIIVTTNLSKNNIESRIYLKNMVQETLTTLWQLGNYISVDNFSLNNR